MYNLDLSSSQFRNHVSKAISYITAEPGHHPQGKNFRHIDKMEKVDAYLDEELRSPLSEMALSLNDTGGVSEELLGQLKLVLKDELDSTKGLSQWPCKSFWDLEGLVDGEDGNTAAASESAKDGSNDILSRNAKRLSPDCDAPFVSCFVNRDKCEFRGEAKCS